MKTEEKSQVEVGQSQARIAKLEDALKFVLHCIDRNTTGVGYCDVLFTAVVGEKVMEALEGK